MNIILSKLKVLICARLYIAINMITTMVLANTPHVMRLLFLFCGENI